MPYLPPKVIADDSFTRFHDDALSTHLGLIREMYYRHYPVVEWSAIDLKPTEMREAGTAMVSGTDGGTLIDALYNEAIPVNPTAPPEFIQPHGGTDDAMAVDATAQRVWKPSVRLPVFFERLSIENSSTDIGQLGTRSLRFTIATVVADEVDLVANPGDVFRYRGNLYDVKEALIPERAYWMEHTNIPLYVVGYASLFRFGS